MHPRARLLLLGSRDATSSLATLSGHSDVLALIFERCRGNLTVHGASGPSPRYSRVEGLLFGPTAIDLAPRTAQALIDALPAPPPCTDWELHFRGTPVATPWHHYDDSAGWPGENTISYDNTRPLATLLTRSIVRCG